MKSKHLRQPPWNFVCAKSSALRVKFTHSSGALQNYPGADTVTGFTGWTFGQAAGEYRGLETSSILCRCWWEVLSEWAVITM